MPSPHDPQSGHSQADEAEPGPERQPDPPLPGSTDHHVQSHARQHGDGKGHHDQAQMPTHAERQLVHERSHLGHEDERSHDEAQDGDGEHLGPSSVDHGPRDRQHEGDGPHVGGVADPEPVALGHGQGVEPLEDQIHDIVGGQGAVGALGVDEDRAGDERDTGQDERCGQSATGHRGQSQLDQGAEDGSRAPEAAGPRGQHHHEEDEEPDPEQDQGVGLARIDRTRHHDGEEHDGAPAVAATHHQQGGGEEPPRPGHHRRDGPA